MGVIVVAIPLRQPPTDPKSGEYEKDEDQRNNRRDDHAAEGREGEGGERVEGEGEGEGEVGRKGRTASEGSS